MEQAARLMGEKYKISVLVKGGHLNSKEAIDIFYNFQEQSTHWFRSNRIDTPHTHGTDCSLSASIASYLAQNSTLHNAIASSKDYLTKAIRSKRQLGIGQAMDLSTIFIV